MFWSRSVLGLIAILLVEACSIPWHQARKEATLPSLPWVTIASFRTTIRDQVQQAYREVAAKPNDPDTNGRMGMLLHAFEQYESAEVCYRRARILDPRRFQWAYYLGLTQVINGKNEEAVATLRGAVGLDPEYLPARLKLAETLLTLGRLDESEETCRSIAQDVRFLAPVYYWFGRVAAAKGQDMVAIDYYRKACQLWPSFGTAHYALALACLRTGAAAEGHQHMAAYQKFKSDGDPQPEDPFLEAVRSLDNTALAHLMKGVELENAGRLDGAIAEHEEAVRQDPKLAQAHANLIALYARQGRTEKAEQEYQATVEINPNLPQSHYDYGVFLVSRRRFREAESAFRKALQSSPNYAEAHSNLGAMLERSGRVEEAVRHYRAAIEDKPNFRAAHFQLGRLLLAKNRTSEAIAQLSRTLTPEDGETPRFMYALGVAYMEAGDIANATRYLRQAGERAASLGQGQLAGQIATTLRRVDEKGKR
jgi:tetratricopeptide (TPR) repeat protein